MAEDSSKKRLARLLVREEGFMRSLAKSPAGIQLARARSQIRDYVRDAGKAGDLAAILAVERVLLGGDLEKHVNSAAMAASLKTALTELEAAERLVDKVRSPKAYSEIDAAHSLPKNRVGGVPRDEARQFFGSHAARLLNQDKSRLDEDEKKIITQRKVNMQIAEKLYVSMQRRALGRPAPAKGKGQGLSP